MAPKGLSSGDSPRARPSVTRPASHSHEANKASTDTMRARKRAQTLPEGAPAEKPSRHAAVEEEDTPDLFDTSEHVEPPAAIEITRTSVELNDLPIELVSLIDNFIESLVAKIHSTPPNIEKLSRLFQDFYALASSHVNTHVSALASRQSRDASPARSVSSISSAASRLRSTLGSSDKLKVDSERPMITAEELEARKSQRKAMESKRGLLEEAVERRLCEGIYTRIYRHKSTEDDALDGKLRSKTAALAVIGISPADLGLEGVDLDSGSTHATEDPTEKERSLREWLESSTKELVEMSQSRYPLGKLGHLKAAHKNIVDTLASSHPSASADDILPVLILALVTVPPEDLHVVSDLHFIQYFRWESKLTGEAAYCLTNLEAAIAFLQSLDLSTLRPDENVSGPVKDTAQQGSKPGTFPPAYLVGVTTDSDSEGKVAQPGTSMGLKAATVLRNRRFSDIVNNPAQAFGFASDAVLNTADQGFKNISTGLGDSYKFLLGKIKEHQEGPKEPIAVPRTLDDARKLVSTPDEDVAGVDDDQDDVDYLKHPMQRDDRVLNLIGGRRDRSADSAVSGRSATSAKKVLFVDEPRPAAAAVAASSPGQSPAVLEQMRLLGTTFNPVARLTSLGRGLARNVSSPVGTPPATKTAEAPAAEGGDLATAFPDIAAALPPKKTIKVAPPIRRFVELQSPADLKLGEVLELLRDYRRLAGALKSMGAFEET